MNKMISEKEAYEQYVKDCHSRIGEFVSEYNFEEWRVMGRPKGAKPKFGNWPTPWPNSETN